MSDDSDSSSCKIVDFGLSKIIGPSQTSLDPFGTLSYVAPEVLLQRPYGKEVDVWSLGVITYLLLSAVLPFDDEDEKEIARQTIQDAVDFSFAPWDERSKAARDACTKMLEKNRQKRPDIEDVLNLEWFDTYKKENDRDATTDAKKFAAYSLTSKDSSILQSEIEDVKERQL